MGLGTYAQQSDSVRFGDQKMLKDLEGCALEPTSIIVIFTATPLPGLLCVHTICSQDIPAGC